MSILSIASDSDILKHSHGEVVNFKRHYNKGHKSVAEIGGLFCPIIFGPEEPYTCLCGIQKKLIEKTTCPVCKVDYVDSTERKQRMGHIDLGIKIISNPLFYKVIGPILGLSPTALSKFCLGSEGDITFELVYDQEGELWAEDGSRYFIDILGKEEGSIWTPNELYEKMKEYGIDGRKTLEKSKTEIGIHYYNLGKSVYDLFNQFVYVTPPADRDRRIINSRIVYAEENIIYLRLIREKYRIERVLIEDTMDEITRKRFMQFESKMIHNLLDKFYIKGFTFGRASEEGKLSKFGSKQGLFRQNLLGKRVDFSGRSVITSGPFLRPDEVGIPMPMLHELFKPILIRELAKRLRVEDKRFNQYKALKLARKEHEEFTERVKKLIEEVCPKYDVFMNRAPSLHRYSVMGHRIRVTYDKAIYFPLMTMGPYNADCFTSDTKIQTLDFGSISFNELLKKQAEFENNNPGKRFEFFVWSRDSSGKQVPGLAHTVKEYGSHSEMVKVKLDNNNDIICTPDHYFLLKSGEYVQAKDLNPGDSLSPIYYFNGEDEQGIPDVHRRKIYDEELGWQEEHWLSYERYYKDSRKGFQIHHSDFTICNNSPLNLVKMTDSDHLRLHTIRYNKSQERIETIRNSKAFINSMKENAQLRNKSQSDLLQSLNSDEYLRNRISIGWHARSYSEIVAVTGECDSIDKFLKHRKVSRKYLESLDFSEIKQMASDFMYIEQAKAFYTFFPFSGDKETFKVKRRGGISYLNPSNRNSEFDKIFGILEKEGLEISKENYEALAKERNVWFLWEDMLVAIGRPLETYLKTRNHKVQEVQPVFYDNPVPTYCITVDDYHNFALSAGCYVKNCDGDTLSVHCPITLEAMKECRDLFHVRKHIMFSHENTPNIGYSNEMSVGSYLLTRYWEKPSDKFEIVLNSRREAEKLYNQGSVTPDTVVKFYNKDEEFGPVESYVTNIGSLIVEEIAKVRVNYVLGKKGCSKLISEINWKNGNDKQDLTLDQLSKLQTLFLEVATKSGISIKYDDTLKSPETTERLEKSVSESMQYEGFERTKFWDKIMNEESDKWFKEVPHDHPLYIMGQSGARVQEPQVKTMIVGKSLLRKTISEKYPMGISTDAIIHSLSEGLNPMEYMETCGPARLAFAQNAFFVPAGGYLERQLVQCGRNLVITDHDCGSEELLPFKKELCINMYSPEYGIIRPEMLPSLPDVIPVRTPITCKHDKGLCQKCCGHDPANRDYWKLGTNIGVIQGQEYASVSQQLAMRGKHFSGILRVDQIGKNADDAIVKFAYLTGSKLTTMGLNKDIETDKFVDIEGESYGERAINLVNKIVNLTGNTNLVYATTLVRAMSDPVELSSGRFALRSRGASCKDPKIYTVHQAILNDPSWLRKLGYGYTRKVLERALAYGESIQKTSSEQIMRGKLIHDCFGR